METAVVLKMEHLGLTMQEEVKKMQIDCQTV